MHVLIRTGTLLHVVVSVMVMGNDGMKDFRILLRFASPVWLLTDQSYSVYVCKAGIWIYMVAGNSGRCHKLVQGVMGAPECDCFHSLYGVTLWSYRLEVYR